jgi:hypothetical protein
LFLEKGEKRDAKDHDLSGRGHTHALKYLGLGDRISMAELKRAILHYLKAPPKPPVTHMSVAEKEVIARKHRS